MSSRDSYERQQKLLQDLFDAATTPDSSQEPFADDGELGSDLDYQPRSTDLSSSEDEIQTTQIKRRRQKQAAISSGESKSSSSSDDDDKTSCSEPEEQRENIEVAQSLDLSVDLIQEPVPLITGVPMVDEQVANVSRDVSFEPNPINVTTKRSNTPVIEEPGLRRYEQILRCICASELDAKGENKIVKFIDMLTVNFRKIYNAGEELSLDESLLLFRGRLTYRQYIKSKKARYGIKFFELTTSDGYVLNAKMYSGKKNTEQDMGESTSKTEKVVMRLMRPYLLREHHLFMDNYYNSVNLSQKLIDLKTHCTDTLRSNRKGNPIDITKKKLKTGEHIWVRKNKVYVSKWKDKRPVLIITTNIHPSIVEVRNRFGKTRLKPAEVEVYNRHMSGIDRSDQMVSCMPPENH
uniref:PiggyBac transposable element-derived protein domain-containing protein n=1 Tax=Heliothis virescens TaxID=7102 RepID=A0A2A4IYX2_HELVI